LLILINAFFSFGECANNVDVTSANCTGLLLCVDEGTTTIETVRQLFPERFIVPKQGSDLLAIGIANNECNAVGGGITEASEAQIRDIGKYDGPYETFNKRFSKDPLALVSRQDDPQWSAFLYWIVSATFYAEENKITSSTSQKMPLVNLFGPRFSRMLRYAIKAAGSYAEIYERNAEAYLPRGGLNAANTNPLQPQHYPYPGLEGLKA